MAEMHYTAQDSAAEKIRSMGQLANWAGAAISLGLIVGVAIWGYQLLMRDVSGIPVVRAIQGPMRVVPDEPGGRPADNQGLAVNSVAAVGAAAAPADRLVLAPRPVDLEDEDAAAAVLAQMSAEEAAMEQVAPAVAEQSAGEPTAQMASIQALAEQISPDAAPLEGLAPLDEEVTTPEAVVEEETEAPVIEGGIARSLRPQTRPEDLQVSLAAAAAAQAVASLQNNEVDGDTIPAGTRLAQLGAFESAEVARQEWDRMNGRFGDYLEGKTRVIQKASSGGRDFYRLRVMGFADLNDARRFCSALVAEKAECIPLVSR